MEGKSLQTLRIGYWTSLLLLVLVGNARSQASYIPPMPRQWTQDGGLFLDANRFTIAKDLDNRALWLEVGLAREFMRAGQVGVGLEALVWSRLRILSDFRFPVETADYFFGVYSDWGDHEVAWRARVSHISSHLVDGTDSAVVGGSSSSYSREFVEISRQCPWDNNTDILWSVGVRAIFHQVSKIEPWFSIPASLSWTFARFGHTFYGLNEAEDVGTPTYLLSTFISSGDGPVWPTVTGGLRLERRAARLSKTDLEVIYQYGASWAGTDAGRKSSSIRLQLSLRDL